MNNFVWVLTFATKEEEQNVLGVFTSREKAVEAVEQMANNDNEWLNWVWEKYGWIHAYDDEEMTDPAGAYHIRAYRLR